MKIWITFDSVLQLQIGGLERCKIWFQKPRYTYMYRDVEYDSLPFGGGTQREGLTNIGWTYSQTNGLETRGVSLGKILNYEGDICDIVWDKLCEFFKSDDLRQWDLQEKKLNLSPSEFLLELDTLFILKE